MLAGDFYLCFSGKMKRSCRVRRIERVTGNDVTVRTLKENGEWTKSATMETAEFFNSLVIRQATPEEVGAFISEKRKIVELKNHPMMQKGLTPAALDELREMVRASLDPETYRA